MFWGGEFSKDVNIVHQRRNAKTNLLRGNVKEAKPSNEPSFIFELKMNTGIPAKSK